MIKQVRFLSLSLLTLESRIKVNMTRYEWWDGRGDCPQILIYNAGSVSYSSFISPNAN